MKFDDLINTIQIGDARELIELIPNESIDLILCDPVYQNIDDYRWLAEIAARVLKPYGSILAQCGHIHRWEAELAMQHDELEKRPLLTEVFTSGFVTIWKHKTLRASLHYIWLEKTGIREDREWPQTLLRTKVDPLWWIGQKDKSAHKWGDGERGFEYIMSRLTKPGEIVLDPFSGSATVSAVAKRINRHWIAFERDEKVALQSIERLKGGQTQMFIPNGEQEDFYVDG